MAVKNLFTFVLISFLLTTAVLAKKQKQQKPNENTEKDVRMSVDLCAKLKCGHGKVCIINTNTSEASCECVKSCSENKDPRAKVCSNTNKTWESDCHLHRHRCLCLDGQSKGCTEQDKHIHIDYYGECKDKLVCEPNVLEDFPRRMREWLYRIMNSRRPSSSSKQEPPSERLADDWVQAVIWKYCNLDVHPKDRFVSRHELFPLRAPLLSMEPCISNFLNSCDPNDDHKISLEEWGKCLGAPEGELEYKCSEYHSGKSGEDEDLEA